MKWVLVLVAVASLIVCWLLGQPLVGFQSGTVNEAAGLIALAIASPTYIAMIMAGLVGMVSIIGAAKIHISENMSKQ